MTELSFDEWGGEYDCWPGCGTTFEIESVKASVDRPLTHSGKIICPVCGVTIEPGDTDG